MKNYCFNLTNDGASLTCYILDNSPEMPNWERRPAMLVIPGGAYKMCSDREAEPVAMAYAALGFNTFVLRYSVGAQKAVFPRPLNDAEEAMNIIVSNADEWHIDTDRIAAVGFSAGGHLCAALATMGRIRPTATVLVYPCILKEISEILAETVPSLDEVVDGNTPPAFIVAAREDDCVPIKHSLAYACALEKNGIDFEIHIYNKGFHGFSTATDVVFPNEEWLEYNKHMSNWVEMSNTWLHKLWKM